MADSKTILILGGGVGGVATARALRKRLPTAHRIVLVDRERDHVFAPSLLWLMVGQRTADAITRPLARLARKGIDVRDRQRRAHRSRPADRDRRQARRSPPTTW